MVNPVASALHYAQATSAVGQLLVRFIEDVMHDFLVIPQICSRTAAIRKATVDCRVHSGALSNEYREILRGHRLRLFCSYIGTVQRSRTGVDQI